MRKTQDRLARISLRQGQFAPVVKLGDARALRFPEASFAVVLCCDGFEGWELSAEDRMVALNEVSRVLVPGGIAILTDYLHPRRFAQYVESIRTGPLAVSEVHYFHDRLWFQTNTNFKFLRKVAWGRRFLGSKKAARAMAKISSLFGPAGSKHLALILIKDAAA